LISGNLQCESKKQDTLLVSITSQNIDRFSKFFHCYGRRSRGERRVYFKQGVQPKCGVQEKNVESKIEKCGVQNSICMLQEIGYFEPQFISFNTIFNHRPSIQI